MAGKNTAAFGIYPNKVALEEGLVALREANFRPEDVSAFLNTRQSDTKAELRKAGFWSRCIATTRTGLTKPKLFYRKPAPRTYPQPERPELILLRAINRCHAGGCVMNL